MNTKIKSVQKSIYIFFSVLVTIAMVSCPISDLGLPSVDDTTNINTDTSTVPGVVSNLQVFPSDESAVVKWDAPTTDGGKPILGYLIEYKTLSNTGGTAQQQETATWKPYNLKRTFDRTGENSTSYVITRDTDASTRSIKINSLPNTQVVEFRVRAVNAKGVSEASAVITEIVDINGDGKTDKTNMVTPQTGLPPTPVTDIQTKAIEEKAVTLTWDQPLAGLPIVQYAVQHAQVTDKNADGKITETDVLMGLADGSVVFSSTNLEQSNQELTTTEREQRIAGLNPNTDYAFRVIASNSNGPAKYGTPLILKTGVTLLNLSINTQTQDPKLGFDEVSLTWDASKLAGKTIAGYKITYKVTTETTETVFNDINKDGFSDDVAANTTSVNIKGLIGLTEYTFTVHAYVGTGIDQRIYTIVGTAGTPTPQGRPGKVANVKLISRIGTSGAFEFQPRPDSEGVTQYILKYASEQKDIALTSLTDTNPASDKKQVTLADLPPVVKGTPLIFTIAAVGKNNLEGIPSDPVQIGPAPNLSADSLKATTENIDASVKLSWTAPTNTSGSPIIGYNVFYSVDGVNFSISKPTQTSEYSTLAGTTNYTVTGLVNNTEYTFRVLVHTEGAVSDESKAPTIKASPKDPATPEAPTAFTATAPTQATGQTVDVPLTWTKPKNYGKKRKRGATDL